CPFPRETPRFRPSGRRKPPRKKFCAGNFPAGQPGAPQRLSFEHATLPFLKLFGFVPRAHVLSALKTEGLRAFSLLPLWQAACLSKDRAHNAEEKETR